MNQEQQKLWAEALGINSKNIYRQKRQVPKDLALKAQIEALHIGSTTQHPYPDRIS